MVDFFSKSTCYCFKSFKQDNFVYIMSIFLSMMGRQGLGGDLTSIFCFCNQHPTQMWLATLHSSVLHIEGPRALRALSLASFQESHRQWTSLPSSPREAIRKIDMSPDQWQLHLENLTLKWASLKSNGEFTCTCPRRAFSVHCAFLQCWNSGSSSAWPSLTTALSSQQQSRTKMVWGAEVESKHYI